MQVDKIEIKENIMPNKDQILNLYKDAGWTAYTDEPEKLLKAIEGSLKVLDSLGPRSFSRSG